jgi:hypothetical protein
MTGNNIVVTHWDAEVTNGDGFQLQNRGGSVMTIQRGKVIHSQHYVFDTSERFRTAWRQ